MDDLHGVFKGQAKKKPSGGAGKKQANKPLSKKAQLKAAKGL